MKTSRFAQVSTFGAGLFYLLVALSMFVDPRWFFKNVGHFPPFNRHYMGDLASFLLPMAVGLLVAARDPFRHRLMIAAVAAGSVIHTLNHAYDALVEGVTHGYWLFDFTPLIMLALALVVAYYRPRTPLAKVAGSSPYGTS
jgi:hypothetical protein